MVLTGYRAPPPAGHLSDTSLSSSLSRSALVPVLGLLIAGTSAAGTALASHGFTDVPADAYDHDAVDW